MKNILSAALCVAILSSCGTNDQHTKKEDHANHSQTEPKKAQASEGSGVPAVKPAFTGLHSSMTGHVKEIFSHYLHIKNALVNTNAGEAKAGADALLGGLRSFDRSNIPAEQKGAYDKSIGGIKASAANIAATNDVKVQREHFATLSNQAYEFAKSFGGGRTLYHEHCPMAFNNKGGLWLSESKEIRNPYYGDEMLECGSVEEIIQQ